MLKIRMTMVALMTCYLLLFGCGGGDTHIDLDAQARADLPGTWRLVQAGAPGSPTLNCPGAAVINGTTVACTNSTTITLNPDGSFRAFDGTTGTWTVTQGQLSAGSGQNNVSGQVTFENPSRVTVRDAGGRFLTFERVN